MSETPKIRNGDGQDDVSHAPIFCRRESLLLASVALVIGAVAGVLANVRVAESTVQLEEQASALQGVTQSVESIQSTIQYGVFRLYEDYPKSLDENLNGPFSLGFAADAVSKDTFIPYTTMSRSMDVASDFYIRYFSPVTGNPQFLRQDNTWVNTFVYDARTVHPGTVFAHVGFNPLDRATVAKFPVKVGGSAEVEAYVLKRAGSATFNVSLWHETDAGSTVLDTALGTVTLMFNVHRPIDTVSPGDNIYLSVASQGALAGQDGGVYIRFRVRLSP